MEAGEKLPAKVAADAYFLSGAARRRAIEARLPRYAEAASAIGVARRPTQGS
jgi:hypothetical protein